MPSAAPFAPPKTAGAPVPPPTDAQRLAARIAARERRHAQFNTKLLPVFPGTKNIREYAVYQGVLTRMAWRFYTHRLTRAGRWFLGLSVFLGLALAPGFDVPLYVPFLYICGLWAVAEAASVLNRPRVRLRVRLMNRVQVGTVLPVEVEVSHAGTFWPAMDLNVLPARLPLAVDAVPPDGVPVGTLLPGESRRVRLGLKCRRRGVYTLWGFRVESDYPFGLLNAYGHFPQESRLLVYPDFPHIERMDLPAGSRSSSGGLLLAAHRGDSFEYLGNREWREGDSVRDIDWRATARFGGQPLALREWREENFLRIGVVLDTYTPPEENRKRRDGRLRALERAVSLTAAVSDYLARQDYIVDLFAAGPELYHLACDGRSRAFLDQILDLLAGVEGTVDEPMETIAPQIDLHLAGLSTVVCLLLEWNEARRDFVDVLRASGVGVKIILVRGGGYDTLPFPADAVVIEAGDDLAEAGAIL